MGSVNARAGPLLLSLIISATPPTVSIEPIHQYIAADMRAVDAVIRASLHSDVVLVRQVAGHIIAGGGKRMRPALVILSAGVFGYGGCSH